MARTKHWLAVVRMIYFVEFWIYISLRYVDGFLCNCLEISKCTDKRAGLTDRPINAISVALSAILQWQGSFGAVGRLLNIEPFFIVYFHIVLLLLIAFSPFKSTRSKLYITSFGFHIGTTSITGFSSLIIFTVVGHVICALHTIPSIWRLLIFPSLLLVIVFVVVYFQEHWNKLWGNVFIQWNSR